MEIIDFERKGNMVRFYLGSNAKGAWGDDFDDRPFEHNAGPVYDAYVQGRRDMVFPFDAAVLDPSCGTINSNYSKKDMQERRVPCIIVVAPELLEEAGWMEDDFQYWVGSDDSRVRKFYFGDKMIPEEVPEFDGNEDWPRITKWHKADWEEDYE